MAQQLTLPEQAVRRLLAAGSGDAALVYLHLAAGGTKDTIMQQLRLDERRLEFAVATLRQLGLWPEEERRHLLADTAPVYTEADLQQEYASGEEFPSMVGETQRRLGRILSTEELKILLCIYRYLGLAPEVISILVNYCIQRSRARGNARMPSLRTIEKEAYRWADNGIDTMEEAAVFVQRQLQTQSRLGRVREILQLGDRKLTPGEEKLARTWLDWGFGENEIRMAYEKTCMNTGSLRWPYLNSILKSWHEQGLTTVQQIESGDRQPERPQTSRPRQAVGHNDAPTDFEREAIRRMMEKKFDEGD